MIWKAKDLESKEASIIDSQVDPTFDQKLLEQVALLDINGEMSEAEIRLTKECVDIKAKLNDQGISESDRTRLKGELKEKYEELKFVRERYDKAISILKSIKTPYYTSDKEKRGYPKKNALPIGVQGVEDPFYEQFNKIYPGQGLRGFIEENPKLFNNCSRDDINLASERYKKVDGICTIIGKWIRIPLIVGLGLLYPVGTQHMPPPIYGLFAFSIYKFIIHGALKWSADSRAIRDNDIFDARIRLAKDLGILQEEDYFKNRTIKESFKFDYGIDVDSEKNEE